MEKPPLKRWVDVKKKFLLVQSGLYVCFLALAFYFWGLNGFFGLSLGFILLYLGFALLEKLIGILTGTIKANPTAALMVFTGKMLWWVALFYVAKKLPNEWRAPLALGMGGFLLAIVITGVAHYGMPKFSEVEQ